MDTKLQYNILHFSHFILTCFMFFGFLSNDKSTLQFLVLLLILGMSLFYINKGCFITRYEKKLSNTDKKIIDPILEAMGVKFSKRQLISITVLMFMISFLIANYKLYHM